MRKTACVLFSLLPLLAALPATTAQNGPGFEATDPRGDVKPGTVALTAPQGAGTTTPLTDPLDIVAFRVTDETEALRLQVQVVQLASSVPESYLTSTEFIEINFGVPGSNVIYSLRYSDVNSITLDGSPGASVLYFCIGQGTTPTTVFGGACARDRPDYRVDASANTHEFMVPKSFLQGRNLDGSNFGQSPVPVPHLDVGSVLGPWKVMTQRWIGFVAVKLEDTLESQDGNSGPFRIQTPVPNQGLILRRAEASSGRSVFTSSYDRPPYRLETPSTPVGVPIGKTTPVTLIVENAGDTKRLVKLEAAFEDPAAQARWSVQAPAAIEVPSGQRRNATVMITAGPEVKHREVVLMRLVARSVSTPEIGFLRVPLVGASPIEPGETRFFLHSGSNPAPANRPCAPTDACQRGYFWMNTLQEDPLANKDDVSGTGTLSAWLPGAQPKLGDFNFMLDTTLPTPVLPVHGAIIPAKIMMSARTDMQVRIDAALTVTPNAVCTYQCGDNRLIASLGKDQVLGPSPVAVELNMPIDASLGPIEAGSQYLRFRVTVTASDPRGTAGAGINGILVYPKQSQFILPTTTDDALLQPASHLRFYIDGDREEFLNPGRTRLFEIRLANEGAVADQVIVNATTQEGWSVQLQPSQRFVLQPGESVGLGVLLKAPEDAPEGARANVNLTAASELFQATPGRMLLKAVATRGIEIEDEGSKFSADEDTEKRIVQEAPKKSPGVPVLALIVVLLACGLRMRAKRRGD